MSRFSRRRFLELTGLTGLTAFAAAGRAIEPFARKGAPRLKLSLAAYSFREFFKDSTHKQKPGVERTLDMMGFIDFCAEHGCDGAELTAYYFPKDVTTEQLVAIRRHAFLRGVAVSGTSVGNNFARAKGAELDQEIATTKQWIDRAAVLGAPHIRVFAGPVPKNVPLEDAKKNCIAALEECCDYAGKHGIFLGLENHGGIVAKPEELLEIVKAVKSPWLGINFDSGNFQTEDPYADLAKIAPYAVNVQVKMEIKKAGSKETEPSDLARVVKILRDANYQGWVALEYEAAEDPWKAVPAALGKLKPLLADSAAAAPAAAEGQSLFDGKTLNGWKNSDFGANGEIKVEDGAIFIGMGEPLSGITLASEPTVRMNYEISLDAMKLTGDDFFCALTVPVGKACGTWVLGGWGGALVGFSSIEDLDASENQTTQFRKFDKNKWFHLRLKVTEKKIEGWIDEEKWLDADIDGKKVSMRPGEIEASQPLGIATFHTSSSFKNIVLRKL